MKKTFDAVAFQRRVRRALTRRYANRPELEEKELAEIREKFGFPEPQRKERSLAVAEERASYGERRTQEPPKAGVEPGPPWSALEGRLPRRPKKGFDCVQMMRKIREDLSKRYAGKPGLMAKELREARERFEARLRRPKKMAVADGRAAYGVGRAKSATKG